MHDIDTASPLPRGQRPASWVALTTLAVACVLSGVWWLSGVAATWVPYLFVPSALGLPSLLPPLRPWPLGATTWSWWAADTVGAVVMLAVAFTGLRAATRRRPDAGPGRWFGRVVGVTVLAVVAGNAVRGVFITFVVHSDLLTYLVQLGAGVVLSALVGVVLGSLAGALAAVAAGVSGSSGVRTRWSGR